MAKEKKQKSAVERARDRLKSMKEKKKGGGDFPFNYLMQDFGKIVVRVFKPWEGSEEFYKELPSHPKVGKDSKSMFCPGEDKCFVCKTMTSRRKKGLDLRKENKAKGDKFLKAQVDPLKPRSRFFMNAIRLSEDGPVQTTEKHKGKPATKPEVWGVGPQVFEQVLGLFVEEEAEVCGSFWDKKNAYDFLVEKKKTGKQDWDVEYTVQPTRKYVKKVPIDTTELNEELHNLDELLDAQVPTPEKAKALFLGEEEEEADEEGEDEETDDTESEDSDEDESDDEPKKGKKSKKSEDEDEEESEDEESDDEGDDSDSDDEDESEDEDEDEEGDDSDEDESEEGDEDESEDEDEKPKKKGKKSSKKDEDEEAEEDDADEEGDDESEDSDEDEEGEEDESEDEDEADESEDEDEEPKKSKKGKGKKEVSQKASPKDEKAEKPICFGDPDDHNPKDEACKGCPFNQQCAATKAVSAKVYKVKGGGAKFGQKKAA